MASVLVKVLVRVVGALRDSTEDVVEDGAIEEEDSTTATEEGAGAELSA